MIHVNHGALQEALGAYAIDAVEDPDERAAIEAHIEICESCMREVDQHRAVAGKLATADSALPDGLWDRVRADIAATTDRDGGSVDPLRRWTPLLSAAAVIVLVALAGLQTIRLDTTRDDLQAAERQLVALQEAVVAGDYAAIEQLASTAPGAVTVALDGEAGPASATILPNGSGYLDVHGLRPLDADSAYQLWAVLDGEVISLAVLGANVETVAPFQVDPRALEALIVTSEAAGGVAVSSQPAASAWIADS